MQLSQQPVLIGTSGAIAVLIEGHRLHLQHGPIDLVIKCEGEPSAIERAYLRAATRFETILPELVSELRELRQAIGPGSRFRSTTAQRMHTAVKRLSPDFITPMAAVAGAVADEILATVRAQPQDLARVFVNNGGDIALWNGSGVPFTLGVVAGAEDRAMPEWPTQVEIDRESNIGGIATSGWRGRSHSLGIADAVSVLAADAATADAAATVIANAVNLQSAKIQRRPACTIDADSDLGSRAVTVAVSALDERECNAALRHGVARARPLLDSGTITGVFVSLQGRMMVLPKTLASGACRALNPSPASRSTAATAQVAP